MRKIYLSLLGMLLFSCWVTAQTASQYSYATLATASLALEKNGNAVDMTSGTTQLVAAAQDDVSSASNAIGFNFTFFGTVYTNFTASSNGGIRLGGTIGTTVIGTSFPVAGQPILAPYLGDIRTSNTGKVHYKLIGAYPNRTLVVEFLNMGINFSNTTSNGTFQARLYEQTNVIEYVYGAMSVGSIANGGGSNADARTVVIGFSNTTGNNNEYSVNQSTYATSTTATPVTNTNSATGTIAGLNSSADGSRRSFIFTPTLPFKSQFISMNTGAAAWCAGETRTVTVTVKNIGTSAWTSAGPNPINLGLKWNTNGANWADYYIRTSAANLAPGATGTFSFSITASNNTGSGYTTVLAAGINNLTFDIVEEGVSWFGNNAGGVGPGNIVYTSPNATINALPSAPTGAVSQAFCASAAPTVSNLTATGTTIKWYTASSGGSLLAGTTALVNGTHYYASQTSVSGCESSTRLDVTVILNGNVAISLSSAAGTDNQSLCAATAITNISYAITGGGTGASITAGSLPAGVSGSFSAGTFTISGTPSASGIFNYTITATGPCTGATISGTVTVNANGTIALSSAAGTNTQTKCVNTAITDITYNIGGTSSAASLTAGALPAGVTGSFSAGMFIISGTPTIAGSYSYTVGASGSACANPSLSGTIMVNENSTISLSSATGTDAQTLCALSPITNITYAIGGFGTTGATVTGLPAGVTGSYSSSVFTISGTPSANGIFNYTVTTTGICTNAFLTGTITANSNGTVTLTSAAGTNAQTVCINNAIANITYAIDASATSASITAGSLPPGVTGSFSGGIFTIAGTPSAAGIFNYTITASGSPCANLSASGSITVNDNSTISLTSAAGTDAQTKCISTAITPVTYLIGGGGTGVNLTGSLPAGVTGSYNAGTHIYSISGTATAAGTFNYTVATTGPCINANTTGTIIIQPNSTITLSSGTASQTKCINNTLTTVTYTMGGSAANISLTAGSFPTGVTGSFAGGVFTISGTPTVAGSFPYTLSATGPCIAATATGTVTINDNSTISLTSAAGTDAQTKCISTAITPITYLIGGGGTGATLSGSLPAGVTGAYNSGTHVYTISGTASAAGTFNYTVTTTGPCVNPNAAGTIIIQPNSTITLSSGTASQTKCINNALTTFTYTMGGSAANISLTAGSFPTGVTGSFAGGIFTISGTPTVAGSFPYTLSATGPCANATASGTITVNDNSTITLTSAAGTNSQTKCINTAITAITYLVSGGGTGVTLTGSLPAGVSGVYNSGTHVYTISGTASAAGTFNYTVTTTGPCTNAALTGSITVTPNATIALSSAAGTNVQTICKNAAITNIAYAIGGSGTGATVTGLPAGVTGNYSSGIYTISGAPTAIGTFNYVITTTGPCINPSLNGTLTVNAIPTGTLTAAENSGTANDNIICAGSGVTFTATSGYGSYIFKVNGTIVQSGTSNVYNSTTLTNGASVTVDVANGVNCGATFGPVVITVNALPNPSLIADRTTICPGDNVLFTANGGTSYTFKVNGSAVQSGTANTYNTTTLANGNSVTVTVTNASACSATSSAIVITVNSLPSGTLSATSTSICAGNNVTFTATGGFSNYNFKVNGSSVQNGSSNTFSSTTLTNPAVVTVVVTNLSGCNATFNPIVVTVNALPSGTLVATENSGTANDNSICSGTNVTFTATSGFNNYNFKVNNITQQNGSSNIYNSSTLLNGDIVTVLVTNGTTCTNTFNQVTITVIPSPAGTLSASATTICVGDNVNFTATAGFSNYDFQVNGSTSQNGSGNSYSTAGLANGDVVTVNVTSANGCVSLFNSITIIASALPSGPITLTENSGNAANDGIICAGANVVFTAPAGYSNYNFQLNSVSVQNGSSNVYNNSTLMNGDVVSVAVTNSGGCIALLNNITITVNAYPVVAAITGTTNVCVDNTTALSDITPGGSWSSSNISLATVNATGVVTGIGAGSVIITYTVTNANGCSTPVNVFVTVNGLPFVAVITGSTNVCVGNTSLLSNSTPGGTWSSNNTTVANVSVSGLVSGIADGSALITYSVTNAAGCTNYKSVTVFIHALPVLNPITGNLNICKGNTSQLANDTDGGLWSSSNTSVATVNSTGLVTGVLAGSAIISYIVTDGNGCSATVMATISILALPVPTLSGPNPICPNSTGVYTTESGQFNYVWSFTGGTLVSGGTSTDNTVTIDWDQPGPKTIHVNYTDAAGCTGAASATVTTTTGIVPFLSGPTPVCLNSNGVYSTDPGQSNYTWTVAGGNISSGGTTADNTATITWTTAGAASVSINYSDVNGCTVLSSTTLPVTVLALPTATISGTTSLCLNSALPVISFTGANGVAPYTFTYNINGGSNQTITTTSGNTATISVPTGTAGIFTYNLLSISSNNSCSQPQLSSATVTVNELATATVSGSTTVCQNNPALISFTGNTGTAPFTFFYNINGGSTQSVTTISGNTITVAASTGTGGSFTYNLLSVSDANGCSQAQTGNATITVNPSPTATVSGTTSVCLNGITPNISFTGADGTAPYTFTYNINGGGNLTVVSAGSTATVSAPTTIAGTFIYNLLSVQESGPNTCSQAQTGSATITVNPASVGGTVGGSTTVCSGTNSGTLTLTGNTGNVTGWEFSINGGATWTPVANTTTSLIYTNLTATTIYHAIVKSGACSNTTSAIATVTVNQPSAGGTVSSSASVCSGTNSGTLTLAGQTGTIVRWEFSVNGGTSWTAIANTTTTQNYTNLTQTTLYRAVVSNGVCPSANSAAATITVKTLPTATLNGTTTVCQNAASPLITFTGANGVAPYTFTYKINAGANLTVVSFGNSVTVSAPTTTVGVYTYTLVSVTSSASCSQNQSGTAVITVTAPPAAFIITPAVGNICQGSVLPLSASGSVASTGTMTFSSGTVNLAIPEGNRASTIAVSGIPAGAIINSMSVNFNITHGYDADLVLNLKAPNNNTLNLVDSRGGSGDNFTNTTISSTSVNPVNAGTAPFPGTYSADASNNAGTPNSNVVNFSGLYSTPNGNWVFNADDEVDCHGGFLACLFGLGTYYTGTLNSWSITFNYTLPNSPVNAVWSPVTGLFTDAGATTAYASQNTSIVYAKPATTTTYTATTTNAANCSTTKTVTVNVSPTPVVTISADYCVVAGKVRLTATSVPAATSYIWSNGATTSFIDVDVAGSFEVTVFAGGTCPGTASIDVAQELVSNGDFELGNVGFITPPLGANQYTYQADVAGNSELNPEGLYGIGPDAHTYHNSFWGHDHTTGTGNFMIINGFPNGNPQPIVWQETVSVLPNTSYYFSAWGMSVNNAGPFAQLQFNVNGTQVGTVGTLPAGVNNNTNNGWTRFYGTWTSGPTTTSAVISITDLQNAAGGNDFGLDDISFATLSTFITLESATGTDAQTLCVNTPLTSIVYSVGNGSPSGPTVTGLPAGVTSSFAGNLLTISGTPTVAGNYTYSITTTGGCLPTSASGTITVRTQAIALTSGSAATTVCANSPVNIGYTISGTATGATVTGLPAGITGSVSGTNYTISGSAATAGTYSYTITTTGTCTAATISGTITVQSQTITLNSGNNNQTVCINAAVGNIQYTVAGTATGVTVSGLPAGVSFSYNSGIVFITGTPTVSGTFNYTVNTTGNCASASATGTINITPAASLVLTSAPGTNTQTVCRNVAIVNITYTVNGATGASATGLPAGVTGSFSAGTFTISGTATVNGTFGYTITTSGGCGTGTNTGTITVQSQTITLTSGSASPSVCNSAAMTNIVYTIGGTATGAAVSGLPAGVGFAVAGNTITISGTPTSPASYPYNVTTSGTCTQATATGTIIVLPGANGGTVASVAICSGGSGSLTVTGQSGTIVRWEYSVDAGATWIPISNTTITQTYNNIIDPTLYRAVVTNGCGVANSSVAAIAVRNYWTGITNTDWNTASNWSDNAIPSLFCADVYIKGGKPNQPLLSSGTASVENIHIYPGAILTVANATLKVAGIIDNTGTFIAANGSVEFNGSVAQTVAAATFQANALNNLIVNNSSTQGLTLAGALDIYRSMTFTGSGRKFNTGGFLTMKSTASETAWIGDVTGNVISGTATVERFIATGTGAAPNHGKSWQLLAVPTTGQTIKQAWQEGAVTVNGNPNPGFGTMLTSNVANAATQPNPGFDVFTAPGPSIKTYDYITNLYDNGPSSTNNPLYNPKGYLILVRGDRSVTAYNQAATPTVLRSKGTLFSPANPPPVTTVIAGKFESVGNPYASALDVRNITKTGGVNEFFFVWDPRLGGDYNLGAYQTIFRLGTDYYAMPGGGSYGSGVNNFIQSGQAFFVQATGTNGTVSFTEGSKANGSALLNRNGSQAFQAPKMLKTDLYAVSNTAGNPLIDGTLNLFDDSYSNNIDALDANKLSNTGENLSVKVDSKLLTIERRHTIIDTDTIFFKLANVRVQAYKFDFTAVGLGSDVEGFVEDKYLNTRTSLNTDGVTTVNFTIENIPGSYASDRFRIVFKKLILAPVPVTFTSVKAARQQNDIDVDWKVENELNITQYELEHSNDGRNFSKLTATEAKLNNGGTANYTYLHKDPAAGDHFYRIKAVTAGGGVQYSTVVKVSLALQTGEFISVYPNPVVGRKLNVRFSNQPGGSYLFQLTNKLGQVVYRDKVFITGTNTVKTISLENRVLSGTYQASFIREDGKKYILEIIIQ